jgi:hypothetical protein
MVGELQALWNTVCLQAAVSVSPPSQMDVKAEN